MASESAHVELDGFRPVKSADRTLDVLEALAGGPCTLSELSRRLNVPKSSLHGLLRTLTTRGWLQTAGGDTRFRLGLRAVRVATAFVDSDEVVARAAPVLDRLAGQTGETVQQGRLDGDDVIYLAKRDSPHPVRLISTIGSRLPAHATALGKALLAARDDETVRALLRFPLAGLTAQTHTEWASLAADLAVVRRRGYAIDDCEATDGLRCFAVTIPGGETTDAVSISVPTFRLSESRETELVAALLDAQAELGRSPLHRTR
ncbi:IclR family transcriptional regulator [Planosporangium mesophilum]|uniref:Glycerol operon regulatory protein n=1 Tax=Planosporangium mesophilum TaxID=689768 RepID=A0A8J3TA19_9ACTN|nr:IclR family transcriptional regulator [Planosporangium mesophilum]NJC83988.1 IclR family transcriptional regulator [Planosporangium mesophilum]GII22643.1 IclR family transcriptional regulator [Planosporangium mesophilum]